MATNNPDTDWLIKQAQRFESLATSSQTFDDADMIEFFNAELQSELMPLIQSVNEEFGVMYVDYAAADLSGATVIRIPSQATGARLRNIQYVSPQGYISTFPRFNPDRLSGVSSPGFYVRNNEVVFYPKQPTWSSGSLRVSYFRRPNTLTAVLETGRVLAVDKTSGIMTLDNAPTGTGWVVGALADIIVGTSPYDFRSKDCPVVAIGGGTVQVASALVQDVSIGDYVALAGYSPVAQFVPLEAMQLLAQMGATRALQSLGDTEGWKIASAKAAEMKNHILNLISDRVEGQPKRLSAIGTSARGGWN